LYQHAFEIDTGVCVDLRWVQGKETETVEHKLKILKRELKHIIRRMTDWKNFVFADPLLPFGTIWEANPHCTHPEEKSGRVQSCQYTINM